VPPSPPPAHSLPILCPSLLHPLGHRSTPAPGLSPPTLSLPSSATVTESAPPPHPRSRQIDNACLHSSPSRRSCEGHVDAAPLGNQASPAQVRSPSDPSSIASIVVGFRPPTTGSASLASGWHVALSRWDCRLRRCHAGLCCQTLIVDGDPSHPFFPGMIEMVSSGGHKLLGQVCYRPWSPSCRLKPSFNRKANAAVGSLLPFGRCQTNPSCLSRRLLMLPFIIGSAARLVASLPSFLPIAWWRFPCAIQVIMCLATGSASRSLGHRWI
jgi:hypothetical protein